MSEPTTTTRLRCERCGSHATHQKVMGMPPVDVVEQVAATPWQRLGGCLIVPGMWTVECLTCGQRDEVEGPAQEPLVRGVHLDHVVQQLLELVVVDPPGHQRRDPLLAGQHVVHGQAAHFVWVNRGKESVTLDLKSEAGRDVLHRLLDHADVLVSNLAPGATARLGLSPEQMAQRHPNVIAVEIDGYGNIHIQIA